MRLHQLVTLLLEGHRQAGLHKGVASICGGVEGDALGEVALVAATTVNVDRARVGKCQVHAVPHQLEHVATAHMRVEVPEEVVGHHKVHVGVPWLVVVAGPRVHGGKHSLVRDLHMVRAVFEGAQVGRPVKVHKARHLAPCIVGEVGPGHGAKQVLRQHQVMRALHLCVVQTPAVRPLDQHQQPVVPPGVHLHGLDARALPLGGGLAGGKGVAVVVRLPDVCANAQQHQLGRAALLVEGRDDLHWLSSLDGVIECLRLLNPCGSSVLGQPQAPHIYICLLCLSNHGLIILVKPFEIDHRSVGHNRLQRRDVLRSSTLLKLSSLSC
mmetsp:Transcript_15969/g.34499  ORF Transcript_15969/g.34499 Transcript_15969/m.34499 type:complete len:325 (-) Transcript_15969:231-1205(-)